MTKVHLIDLNDSNIQQFLKITDLENMFSIYEKKDGKRMFNLNETLYVVADLDALLQYECKSEMHWPLISYQIYGTTRLAWLLCKLNDVKAHDIFKTKLPGDKVFYLQQEYVDSLVNSINDVE